LQQEIGANDFFGLGERTISHRPPLLA
jgi:hypothetical protein